jgi:FkbM family methyltransferase
MLPRDHFLVRNAKQWRVEPRRLFQSSHGIVNWLSNGYAVAKSNSTPVQGDRVLKRIASYLPGPIQQRCRKLKYAIDLRRSTFQSPEAEYAMLPSLVKSGDWVLDIGANVGYYTTLLSRLVGPSGRVFAFEPMPQTVEILAFVLQQSGCFRNVTLLNTAVGESAGIVRFDLPVSGPGLPNYFRAHMQEHGAYSVYCTSIDQLAIPKRVAFIKIDAEGAETQVLRGMRKLIERDRPIILAEGSEESLHQLTDELGYRKDAASVPGSANLLFTSAAAAAVTAS